MNKVRQRNIYVIFKVNLFSVVVSDVASCSHLD